MNSYDFENYYTPSNLFWGSTGERIVTSAVNLSFRKQDGYYIKHNNFEDITQYCTGYGMDITIQYKPEGYGFVCAIEVKNLKDQKKPYGTDFVKRHILPRGEGITGLKLLVITFLSLLTKQGIELLKKHGWKFVEVEERLTYEFYEKGNRYKLYELADKIKKAVRSLYNKLSSLPYYINKSTSKQHNDSNKSFDTPKLHDTPALNKLSIRCISHPKHHEVMRILLGG